MPAWKKTFVFSRKVHPLSDAHPASYLNAVRNYFPGVKEAGA
jgi:hypothetical protein